MHTQSAHQARPVPLPLDRVAEESRPLHRHEPSAETLSAAVPTPGSLTH